MRMAAPGRERRSPVGTQGRNAANGLPPSGGKRGRDTEHVAGPFFRWGPSGGVGHQRDPGLPASASRLGSVGLGGARRPGSVSGCQRPMTLPSGSLTWA